MLIWLSTGHATPLRMKPVSTPFFETRPLRIQVVGLKLNGLAYHDSYITLAGQ